MLRRGGGAKKVAKKAGGGASFLSSLKAAKDPQSIQALVHKLKDGPAAGHAFDDTCAYTFEEIQKALPNIATKHDEESTLRVRVGLMALAMFAIEDKAPEEYADRLNEVMESAVFDILDVEDATGVALALQIPALFLACKIAQAMEGEAEDFVDKIMDFISAKIKVYHEALTKAGAAGLAADVNDSWRAFLHQAGEYIVTIVTISADAIAPHCVKFFPAACALLPLSPVKAELMDIIGHTAMLAIKASLDEAGEESEDEDEDDEDEDDEKEHGADFLEQKLLIAQLHGEDGEHHDEVPFVITPNELPYETLKAMAVECAKIFEQWFQTGNDDLESGSAILGVCTALSAQRYTEEQHTEIMSISIPPLIAKIKSGSNDYTKMREVITSLRDVLRHALPKAFKPFFTELYEGLRKLHQSAKEWIKQQGSKKQRKVYNAFRSSMLKAFGAVISKDPQSLADVSTNFLSEVAPVFADPMILAEFVGTLAAVQDEKIQTAIKDKYLPEIMKQLLGELKKETISKYVRELIIDSVSRVGLKTGALFEPYFDEAHALLIKSIEMADNEFAEKSINGIAMLFEGCKTKPETLKKAVPATLEELEKILKQEVNLAAMMMGMGEEDEEDEMPKFKKGSKVGAAAFGLKPEDDEEDGEFDEEEMANVDAVVRMQHKALLALQYFCKEAPLTDALATAPAAKLEELFAMLIGKLSAVSFFEDDFMLKIPQVAILSTLIEKVPSLRTAENKQKLSEAFNKLDVDFDELQDAVEKLEKLTL